MRRVWIASIVLALAVVGSCRWLLPERFAVNAPIGHMLFGRGAETPAPDILEERFRAPEGYAVGLFAGSLDNPRMLRFTSGGDLLVSAPRSGRILLVERDADGDGASDGTRTLLEGLARPHGMDFFEKWLYVAEGDGVGRIEFDPATGQTRGSYERVVNGLPAGGNHWTRTLRFGPDGWMYVSIGSSCNVCEEDDPRRAGMVRYRPDGSDEQIVARGLRNSVGFDWQPGTERLYATDNGRDLLGDDFPPCELNQIQVGGFYGWPYANGDRIPDPDFGAGNEARVESSIPPVHGFRAHNAPLGMAFVRGAEVGEPLRGAALVALHGSWNRTRKDGYKVVSLHWDGAGGVTERDFLTGFLDGDDVIGRPVDVAEGPDGAIYVSDDFAGAIYRVAPSGGRKSFAMASATAPAAKDPLAGLTAAERAAREKRGRALFESSGCAACHDAGRAQAGVVAVRLQGLGARYSIDSLTEFLAAPTPPMPPVDLAADARRDLAVHLLAEYP
jgi:glucose/arabinose dehydrogenase/cytochrome c553